MVTTSEEQAKTSGEPKASAGLKEASKEEKVAVSEESTEEAEETEDTETEEEPGGESEEEETEEKPAFTFKTQEEYEAAIEKTVQSRTDKQLKSLQKDLADSKAEFKKLTDKLSDKREDHITSKLHAAEKEEWGDTPETRNIHDAENELILVDRKLRDKAFELDGKEASITTRESDVEDTLIAIEYLVEDSPQFLEQLDAFKKFLSGGRDTKEKRLIAQIRAKEFTAPEEAAPASKPKKKTPKPDSSRASATGGSDLTSLSPAERVKEADRRLRA